MNRALALIALVAAGCTEAPPDKYAGYSDTQRRIAESVAHVEYGNPPPPAAAWSYSEAADPMSDKVRKYACTLSTNRVRQSSPYADVQAELCIRDMPGEGLDAYVTLKGDGQILCRSYEQCAIPVRFGDGPAQSFGGIGAGDGSTNMFFFTNPARLVAGAKAADVTRVQVTIYRDGDQVIEFPTAGLEWPRPAA